MDDFEENQPVKLRFKMTLRFHTRSCVTSKSGDEILACRGIELGCSASRIDTHAGANNMSGWLAL